MRDRSAEAETAGVGDAKPEPKDPKASHLVFSSDKRPKERITEAYTMLIDAELELRRVTARKQDADNQLVYLINRYHKRDLISLNREIIEEYITAPEVDSD